MRLLKVLVAALVAASLGGCAARIVELPNGTIVRSRRAMPQVGVIITVVNNCAAWLVIDSMNGREVGSLAYSMRATVPIPSRFLVGSYYREIWAMARAYSGPPGPTTYIGSVEFRESVSTYQGTRDRLWQVDRLRSPQGARCAPP